MPVRRPLAALAVSALALALLPGAAPPSYQPPAGDQGASGLFPSAYGTKPETGTKPQNVLRPRRSLPDPPPQPSPARGEGARKRGGGAGNKPSPTAPVDPPVRRVAVAQPPAIVEPPTTPDPSTPAAPVAVVAESGQNLSLQAALYGAIRYNPDLVTLRNSNVASAEAVEVARRFPTALNPTLWIDYRPITLIPRDTFGSNGTGGRGLHRLGHDQADRAVLPLRPELLPLLDPPADRTRPPDDPPPRGRQGRAQSAAMERRPGRASRAGPDLPVLPDRRLPPRTAPRRAEPGRIQRQARSITQAPTGA